MTVTHERIGALIAELKATSPADTVAWAFGIGDDVLERADESGGRAFDLASLTKPLFTAPTVLGLLAHPGELDHLATDRVADLGGFVPPPSLRSLLTHTAGLPAELPVDADPATAMALLTGGDRGDPDQRRVVYSDPGYWLLGRWAESVTGHPLDELFAAAPTARAPGFVFGGAAADLAVPAGPIEDGMQRVHDPAALTLGRTGHAGAFGSLDAVVGAVTAWLRPSWLPGELADAALTCQTHAIPGGHRSLAWTLAGDPFHVVAHDWPNTTVSHSGFTGVSAALDPVSGWWAVLLTNAIPVERDATPILIARRRFHAEAARRLREAGVGYPENHRQ